jgi:PIN domain nuclease of toxin-antitoxin system
VILLDSHVVLRLAEGAHNLSRKAQAAIEEERRSGGTLAICDITLAELATAHGKRRFSLSVPLDTFLEETEARFTVFPITARTAARSVSLPASYPRDPADRVIGATALVQGLSLVTADRAIRKSGVVPVIW